MIILKWKAKTKRSKWILRGTWQPEVRNKKKMIDKEENISLFERRFIGADDEYVPISVRNRNRPSDQYLMKPTDYRYLTGNKKQINVILGLGAVMIWHKRLLKVYFSLAWPIKMFQGMFGTSCSTGSETRKFFVRSRFSKTNDHSYTCKLHLVRYKV